MKTFKIKWTKLTYYESTVEAEDIEQAEELVSSKAEEAGESKILGEEITIPFPLTYQILK